MLDGFQGLEHHKQKGQKSQLAAAPERGVKYTFPSAVREGKQGSFSISCGNQFRNVSKLTSNNRFSYAGHFVLNIRLQQLLAWPHYTLFSAAEAFNLKSRSRKSRQGLLSWQNFSGGGSESF